MAKGEEDGQPSATNMYELKWSDELAELAQSWTNQCTFGHDKNRVSINSCHQVDQLWLYLILQQTPTHYYVGQNVAWATTPPFLECRNYGPRIQLWYDEVKDFDPRDIKPFSEVHKRGVVGHYTQLVWASTKEVGCGWVQFKLASQSYAQQVLKIEKCSFSKYSYPYLATGLQLRSRRQHLWPRDVPERPNSIGLSERRQRRPLQMDYVNCSSAQVYCKVLQRTPMVIILSADEPHVSDALNQRRRDRVVEEQRRVRRRAVVVHRQVEDGGPRAGVVLGDVDAELGGASGESKL